MVENYGIKSGSNINTNTRKQLKLTSEFSTLKMYRWGDAEFTTDGSAEGSVEIEHDLGYPPMVVVWRKLTAQYTFLAATTYSNAYMYQGGFNPYAPTDNNLCSVVTSDSDKITISNFPAIGSPLPGGNQNSTLYQFRYMIFVDKTEDFNDPSNIALTGDYGFKVSKPGVSVLTGEEYEMAYSSKYRAVQYYSNHVLSSSLTLPAMFASHHDQDVEAATYVDFNHNLGYAPYFFVYTDYGTANWYQLPILEQFDASEFTISGYAAVNSWSDASRVRVVFTRRSYLDATYGAHSFSSLTINLKCIIFTENLAETPN